MAMKATATKPRASAINPYTGTKSPIAKRPKSVHESTVRRIAKRVGLQAKKQDDSYAVIDPSTDDVLAQALTGLGVLDFCAEWDKAHGGAAAA